MTSFIYQLKNFIVCLGVVVVVAVDFKKLSSFSFSDSSSISSSRAIRVNHNLSQNINRSVG